MTRFDEWPRQAQIPEFDLPLMVLYFFYKNVSFVLIPFWYQFLSGFGGANPVDDMILLTFNLLFNSVPPLVQGVLDQDVSANTLELGKNYNLYQQGVRSEVYLPRTFWLYWMLGCYQSLVCFWVPYLYFIGSDLGYLSLGWITSTSIILSNLLSLAVEFKNMTWIHIASEVGSFVLFIGVVVLEIEEFLSPASDLALKIQNPIIHLLFSFCFLGDTLQSNY